MSYNVSPAESLSLDVLSAALDAGTAVGTILVYFWQVPHLDRCYMSGPMMNISVCSILRTGASEKIRFRRGGGTTCTSIRRIGMRCHCEGWHRGIHLGTSMTIIHRTVC